MLPKLLELEAVVRRCSVKKSFTKDFAKLTGKFREKFWSLRILELFTSEICIFLKK